MKWTTPVTITADKGFLAHGMPMLVMGSCFAENMGAYLRDAKFAVCPSPYGTLYNPESIACGIERLMERRPFEAGELCHDGNLWYSYMHHGSFSHPDAGTALRNINSRYLAAAAMLPRCQRLLVTWGTAHIYRLQATHTTVANCHKQPERLFERARLRVDDIVARWDSLTESLATYAPGCRILLTVSPIRHLRDGAHPNQLSKATLLLAAEELCRRHEGKICYFPAYEIVMDELRDYRFYADDLTHPSEAAVAYIREKLAEAYFTPATAALATACCKIQQGLRHRPINGAALPAYRAFARRLLQEMHDLAQAHPEIDFNDEEKQMNQLLQHNQDEL